MKHTERAFLFPCAGETLPGIVSLPDHGTPPEVGLLIVVGGPQYRVGSHRLFVKLARHAASQGLAAMRFDYRGMGDATGEMRTFEHIDDDLAAAMGAFRQQVPSLKHIVLWGLCDGASAACMYAARDPHVQGLILLNPWVHTTEGAAETKLRHYYLQRLFSAALWRKLLSGQMPKVRPFLVQVLTLVRGRLQKLLQARSPATQSGHADSASALPLPQRTGHLLGRCDAPVAVMLSTDDKVAREFEEHALPTPEWQAVQRKQWVALASLEQADHTVTSPEAAQRLCEQTVAWVRQMASR